MPVERELGQWADEQAFSTMLTGRPGPVHLDVPLNVFVETADAEIPDPVRWRGGVSPRVAAHPDDVERALHLLLAAERPVIVAGHGVELGDAGSALAPFASATGIPVAHTPLGKGVIDTRSPLSLGATGRNGTYAANRATREADLILALGTRFDDRSTSAWLPGYTYAIPPTRLIHIDLDPAEIGRNYPPALAIVANAKDALEQLHRAVAQRGERDESARADWPARVAWRRRTDEWERHLSPQRASEARPIRPERLLADVRAVLPEDGILLSDVGIHHNWIAQEWHAYAPRTVLQSWGFASMGFGVAGVLCARLAAPERPVLSIVGDGGFLLMPSAVATAVEYDLPAVWLVWNNHGYVSIRDPQRGYFGSDRELVTSFTRERTGELYSPDYAAMARSMGADGWVVAAPTSSRNGSRRPCSQGDRACSTSVSTARPHRRPPRAGTCRRCPTPGPTSAGTRTTDVACVLITGGAGFLGSHLAESLVAAGRKVVLYDNFATGTPASVRAAGDQVESVNGDILDLGHLVRTMRRHEVDQVVHGAAVVGVPASLERPLFATKVNIEGSLTVFEACLLADVRWIVDISCEEVYGQFTDAAVDETAPQCPVSPYGIGKHAVELLAGHYAQHHGLPYVAARLCWVYGPRFPDARLPQAWLMDALAGRDSALDSGADQRVDFTYIDDAVDGLLRLLDAERLEHRAYHLATGAAHSIRDLAGEVQRLLPDWRVRLGAGTLEQARGYRTPQKARC